MGDSSSLGGLSSDRAITSKSSGIKSPKSRVVDSMSNEWTDEKHSLYLKSIEASFVNQLYSGEHLSKDLLGWSSRTREQTSSYGSSASSLLSGQFKVQRWDCWEKLKSERAKRWADIEKQSHVLSKNPWIQHFVSPSLGKDPHITASQKEKELYIAPSNQVECNQLAFQSTGHGREAVSLKQRPACYSHLYCQPTVGSYAEVSDQNFVDKEFERGEQSSRNRKRARSSVPYSPIKDQVVPSGKLLLEPSSDECHDYLGRKKCRMQ